MKYEPSLPKNARLDFRLNERDAERIRFAADHAGLDLTAYAVSRLLKASAQDLRKPRRKKAK